MKFVLDCDRLGSYIVISNVSEEVSASIFMISFYVIDCYHSFRGKFCLRIQDDTV
jgi:hypothetical protein